MSEVEKLEAEYRALATKLIYASFEGKVDPKEQAEFDRLGERLSRMNSADFSKSDELEPAHA